jgi:twinkle protein
MVYETVIDKETKQEYEVLCDKSGENPQKCPVCSDNRKKENRNKKSFSYNAQTGIGHCMNCEFTCYRKQEDYKSFVRPQLKTNAQYSDKLVEWFQKRQITVKTLEQMRVTEAMEWMSQTGKEMNVVCFNYFRDGQLINTKFRDGAKNFKMVKDAEKIFYNLDGIKGKDKVYIVEGEMDCLTMVQCGYTNTVSVPNSYFHHHGSHLQATLRRPGCQRSPERKPRAIPPNTRSP